MHPRSFAATTAQCATDRRRRVERHGGASLLVSAGGDAFACRLDHLSPGCWKAAQCDSMYSPEEWPGIARLLRRYLSASSKPARSSEPRDSSASDSPLSPRRQPAVQVSRGLTPSADIVETTAGDPYRTGAFLRARLLCAQAGMSVSDSPSAPITMRCLGGRAP